MHIASMSRENLARESMQRAQGSVIETGAVIVIDEQMVKIENLLVRVYRVMNQTTPSNIVSSTLFAPFPSEFRSALNPCSNHIVLYLYGLSVVQGAITPKFESIQIYFHARRLGVCYTLSIRAIFRTERPNSALALKCLRPQT